MSLKGWLPSQPLLFFKIYYIIVFIMFLAIYKFISLVYCQVWTFCQPAYMYTICCLLPSEVRIGNQVPEDVWEPPCWCLESILSLLQEQASALNFFLFCIYVFDYTVALFRHTWRGHWIPLQMVVSHHVVAGIELRTSGRAVSTLNRWAMSLAHPPPTPTPAINI